MKRTVCVLLTLLLLLTGCGAYEQPAEKVEEKPTEVVAEKQPAEEPAEPICLNLGGINLIGSTIERTVKEFNKSQDEIVVELKDYMQDAESKNQAVTRFQTEVLSGNPPDLYYFPMLDFEGAKDTINILSPLVYLSKGFLMDLDPFVEADPDLKPEDFLIWQALHQYGKMYLLSNSFTIQTVACAPDFYEEHQNWTIDEYMEIEAQLEKGQHMFDLITPEDFIAYYCSRYMRGAMDLDKATCDFDNKVFISILEDALEINAYEFEWTGVPAQKQTVDGTIIAGRYHQYGPDDMTFDRIQSGGTRMAYIGWPTPDGSNGTDIQLTGSMGISSVTDHPEACWQMVRYYVTHWTYGQVHAKTWGTPVYAPEMEKFQKAVESDLWGKDMNQEDIDQFTELAAQSETLNFYDATVMELIMEEAEEMFKGNATPEQAAKNVQARASLYMQEQYG